MVLSNTDPIKEGPNILLKSYLLPSFYMYIFASVELFSHEIIYPILCR